MPKYAEITSPATDAGASPMRLLIAWQPGMSAHKQEAIDVAAWLARSFKVQIRAVSTLVRPWPASSISKIGPHYEQWMEEETSAYQKHVKTALKDAGIGREAWDNQIGVVLDGLSESTLLAQAAQEYDAHLLIVGSQATAPKGRFVSGSTSDALLHSSPIPLGLAPRSVKLSKRGITRVNVAYLYDDDQQSLDEDHLYSLTYGAELAQRLDVTLRLLAFSPSGLSSPSIDEPIAFTKKLSAAWTEHALNQLDRARETVSELFPDVNVDISIGSGSGWGGAIESLKWRKGDIVCMASSASGTLQRVFVGSTATQFLKNITVPVIVHPARK